MKLIVKIHKKEDRTIIAVCDDSLAGSKIEEGNLVLDLNSDFFKGEECNEKIAGDLIRNADAVNLVGKEAVQLGIEEGIIEESNVKIIKNIPYAQAAIVHE